MIVLALDLARTTGWACGPSDKRPEKSGSIRFGTADASRGIVFSEAQRWIWEFLREHKPKVIVWESPILLPTDTPERLEVPFGLPAIVEAAAYNLAIYNTRKADVHSIRKFFLGFRPKRDEAKLAVTQRCRVLGFEPKDDNEADAIACWFYQAAHIDRAIGANVTPLFAKHFAKKD